LVEAQRGDVAVLDEPETMLRQAELRPVTAERKGYVTGVDARRVGWAVRALKEATGAHKRICGVILHAKTGDRAAVGEPLATVLGARSSGAALDTAAGEIAAAYRLGDTPPPSSKLLVDVLGA
jgi:pyrimidine-nucleoside phosphorylase